MIFTRMLFHLDDNPFSFDYLSEFLAAFDFGCEFGWNGNTDDASVCNSLFSFGSYKQDDASFSFFVESYVGFGCHCRHCRRKYRPNRMYLKISAKQPCWYKNFLRPGITHNLTHELLNTDCNGKFRSRFQMLLSKIEELTDIFISRGYLQPARSLMRQSEFRERSELLIMTVLYCLGTCASFCTCQALCTISISEVCKLFPFFLHAMYEMRDEYISLPTNILQLRRITIYFKEAGLPGCCRLMDVVHVK